MAANWPHRALHGASTACHSGGVHEILEKLTPGAYVLDLGSRTGSFPSDGLACKTVCVDAEIPTTAPPGFVAARAEALPFRAGQFQAVISNHSLEHFEALDQALDEIGRVVDKNGFLYVAVPDSSTLTDHIYRWIARGGGHVNGFTSAGHLAGLISQKTGLPHVGTRVLCTSLSFLNRANVRGWPRSRLWPLGGGHETILRLMLYGLRLFDRLFRTRTCVYGWACYFGTGYEVHPGTWTNVCVRCGSAHYGEWLLEENLVKGRSFACPQCGAKNYFTDDSAYGFLR